MSEPAHDPVREYLRSVYGLKLEAARLTDRVRELTARCEKATTVLTGMPRGNGSDPEKLLALLADERADLDAKQLAAEIRSREVETFIGRLTDPLHREILCRRYIECRRWPEILAKLQAQGIPYEERQMFRLHGQALNAARELWAKEHELEEEQENEKT